jgi:hypothetical protein
MNTALTATLLVAGGMAVLSLVPVHGRRNPPVLPVHTIEANLEVPPNVQAILSRACQDCHSYNTRWPWYSKVVPESWLTASDVERGREAVNLSEWSIQAGRKRTTAIGALAAACEDVKMQRMPPPAYRLLHPDAALERDDVESLCAWSVDQMRQLNPRLAAVRHGRSLAQ